jgi:hypothetical protein
MKKLLIILAVFLVVGVASANVSFLDRVADKAGQVLGQNLSSQVQIDNKMSKELGAVASPDIPSRWLKVGGVTTHYRHMSMKTATDTPCALQAPSATSTLVYATAHFDTTTTTNAVLDIANDETAFATTTKLMTTQNITANETNTTYYASTTPTAAQGVNNLTTFSPDEYVVFKMGGGTNVFSPTGYCTAVFRSVE